MQTGCAAGTVYLWTSVVIYACVSAGWAKLHPVAGAPQIHFEPVVFE